MSESFEVIIQDDSKSISPDQLATHLFGIPIEVIEVKFIDSESGIFSVMVSNRHEKSRLAKMGILEISDCILTIMSSSAAEETFNCPFCSVDMSGWQDEEKSMHTITCADISSHIAAPTVETPFTLTCPYPECGLRVECRNFPRHVFQTHAQNKQNLSCPICQLLGEIAYQVKPDTNLITHLQSSHTDLLDTVIDPYIPIMRPKPNPIPLPKPQPKPIIIDEYPENQPSDYIVQIPKCDSQDECPICYEFLLKGMKIARLPCFCVYHQTCIEAWFTQKSARKCPLHGMDKT
jgi:hypothetical protein